MQAPQGLAFPRLRLTVPPGLDLLIFAAGARHWSTLSWWKFCMPLYDLLVLVGNTAQQPTTAHYLYNRLPW